MSDFGPPQKCKSCQASILWAITDAKKQQPIDAEPSTEGNLVLTKRGTVLYARVADLFSTPGPRYMPHHATCPQGKEWQRR